MVPTSLTGVSAPQREASMGVKTVLAKESFWRLVFECHLDFLVQGERIFMGWENYNKTRVGAPVGAAPVSYGETGAVF